MAPRVAAVPAGGDVFLHQGQILVRFSEQRVEPNHEMMKPIHTAILARDLHLLSTPVVQRLERGRAMAEHDFCRDEVSPHARCAVAALQFRLGFTPHVFGRPTWDPITQTVNFRDGRPSLTNVTAAQEAALLPCGFNATDTGFTGRPSWYIDGGQIQRYTINRMPGTVATANGPQNIAARRRTTASS